MTRKAEAAQRGAGEGSACAGSLGRETGRKAGGVEGLRCREHADWRSSCKPTIVFALTWFLAPAGFDRV